MESVTLAGSQKILLPVNSIGVDSNKPVKKLKVNAIINVSKRSNRALHKNFFSWCR